MYLFHCIFTRRSLSGWNACWGVKSMVWCRTLPEQTFYIIFQVTKRLSSFNSTVATSLYVGVVNRWKREQERRGHTVYGNESRLPCIREARGCTRMKYHAQSYPLVFSFYHTLEYRQCTLRKLSSKLYPHHVLLLFFRFIPPS